MSNKSNRKKMRNTRFVSLVKSALFFSAFIPMVSSCNDDDAVPSVSIGDRASAIIESFETGDVKPATDYINATTYIQHNLQAKDGRDFIIEGVKSASANGTKVSVKRTMTDGDLTFSHTDYTNIFGQNMAAFDVYKFNSNGEAVEHWDNLQTITPANASGHTLLDGSTIVTDLNKTEENRILVNNYVKEVLIDHKFDNLAKYVATNLIQHNPQGSDGLAFLQQSTPFLAQVTYAPKKTLAQGNFVLVMSQVEGFESPTAVYDMFRIENGKIAEHWDIIQTIPDKSTWANQNGKW